MKLHNLPSSFEASAPTTIVIPDTSTTTNTLGGNHAKELDPNSTMEMNGMTTSTAPAEISVTNQSQAPPSNTSSNPTQSGSSTTTNNLTNLTFSDLVYDTAQVTFAKYFYGDEYPANKNSSIQFPHFIPTYETYMKGNRAAMADWGYSAITCPKRMQDIDPNKKKQMIPFSISFVDMRVFMEVIYNYIQLRKFELDNLPSHLQSPEACTRYIFQNVLSFCGVEVAKESIETKVITKQQFMDYCLFNLSKETTTL